MGKKTSLTAITGGIGCGKSVVSEVLRSMGYPVYDCDSRARAIMDSSEEIRFRITSDISADVVDAAGVIDRKRLSEIVFADADLLNRLNSIVHKAVVDDIGRWRDSLGESCRRAWVESAIIYESGIDRIVDSVWQVEAPVDLRIERVMSRNGVSADSVRQRIEAQSAPHGRPEHSNVSHILNDGVAAVLPQLQLLLAEIEKRY